MLISSLSISKRISHKIVILILPIIAITLLNCAQVYSRANKLEFGDKKVYEVVKRAAKLFDKKKYDEALDTFIQAEKLATINDDKLQIANIMAQGGYYLLDKKLFKESLSYYEQSLVIAKSLDNKPALIVIYTYIGKINENLGNYTGGIENYEQALRIQRQLNDKAGIVHNLINVANLYSFLGDYAKSLELLDEAISLGKQVSDPKEKAKAYVTLGHIHMRLRNYQKSIENLKLAYEISNEIDEDTPKAPGEINIKSYALNLMGIAYRYQGRYENALENYKTALKINEKLKLKTEASYNLSSIGELYKELGRYDEALKNLEKALEIATEQKDKLTIAINQSYIGEVKYKQKNYSQALALYNDSLNIFTELGAKDRIARSYNHLGYLNGEIKDFDASIKNFDKSIAIYKDLGDREWIRVALFGKGVALEEKGNLAQAEVAYKEAVDIFESIRQDVVGGEEGQLIFSEVNEELYERLISLLLRMGKREEAFEYIERSKSKKLRDTLLDSGVTAFDANIRAVLEQYDQLSKSEASLSYQLAQEKASPSPDQEKINNLTKTLSQTRDEFERLNTRLVKEYPQINYLLGISPQSLSSLRETGAIPENFAIVQYFITNNETFVFIASRDELVVETVSISKKELNKLVSQLREVIYQNSDIPTKNWQNGNISIDRFKETSTRLYDYLIKPAQAHIQDVETVGIVPFGSLNLLPFQALAMKRSNGGGLEFFLEQKNIIYLTSANYLNMILRLSKERGINTIVAFGDPDLGKKELALPYAREEVFSIKNVFPNTVVYVEHDATKNNFRNIWGQKNIVHVAAHGVFKGKEPLIKKGVQSRGILQAQEESPIKDSGSMILLAPFETGYLTTQEITGLPPSSITRLIVLSGCETAVFYEEEDPDVDQLPSMALSFTWVGIPSVLATLWHIHDEGTSILMKDFYKNLNSGNALYQSLREAQLEMLKRGDKYGQPFYWAPFILYGAWH